MADISGANSNLSQLDQLEIAFRQSQQFQIDRLEEKKQAIENKSTFFNSLNSRLNSIVSRIDTFELDNAPDRFRAKQVISSSSDFVTATASGDALEGVNTVRVNRLAKNDLLISGRYELERDFEITGIKSLEFIVGDEIKTVEVDFDQLLADKKELLISNGTLDGDISDVKLNYDDAVTGIIRAVNLADIGINTSSVKDSNSTARMTFRAVSSGTDGSISFNDSDIFSSIGLLKDDLVDEDGNRRIVSDSEAGYRVSDKNELDASAVINGVNVTSSSNSIGDAVEGLTIELKQVQSSDDFEVVLNTSINTKEVTDFITPFIASFNELVNFLREEREIVQTESSASSLSFRLRSLLSERITTAKEGNPNFITNIGLSVNSDGTLSISDNSRLEELLEEDPQKVIDIFISGDGIIDKVKSAVEVLKNDDEDFIRDRTLALADQIDNEQNRIENVQDRIDRQAQAQRDQFQRVLEAFFEAQTQFNSYSAFFQGSGQNSQTSLLQQSQQIQ